jgi:hypothetical protein
MGQKIIQGDLLIKGNLAVEKLDLAKKLSELEQNKEYDID